MERILSEERVQQEFCEDDHTVDMDQQGTGVSEQKINSVYDSHCGTRAANEIELQRVASDLNRDKTGRGSQRKKVWMRKTQPMVLLRRCHSVIMSLVFDFLVHEFSIRVARDHEFNI